MLTLGTAEADEQCRYAASIGINKATLVDVASMTGIRSARRARSPCDPAIEDGGRPFDLIVFGNESADTGGFQVGVRVARALGRPMVNAIKGVEVSDDGADARPSAKPTPVRGLPTPLPCAVGVKEGITWPATRR